MRTVNNIVGINENSSIRLDYCNYGLSERCVKYENTNGHTKIQIKKWANGMTTQDGIYTEYIE